MDLPDLFLQFLLRHSDAAGNELVSADPSYNLADLTRILPVRLAAAILHLRSARKAWRSRRHPSGRWAVPFFRHTLDRLTENICRRNQSFIPFMMPEMIIDLFQVVEIQGHNAGLSGLSPDHALTRLNHACPVLKSGQGIRSRQLLQLRTVLLLLRPDLHVTEVCSDVQGQHIIEINFLRLNRRVQNAVLVLFVEQQKCHVASVRPEFPHVYVEIPVHHRSLIPVIALILLAVLPHADLDPVRKMRDCSLLYLERMLEQAQIGAVRTQVSHEGTDRLKKLLWIVRGQEHLPVHQGTDPGIVLILSASFHAPDQFFLLRPPGLILERF